MISLYLGSYVYSSLMKYGKIGLFALFLCSAAGHLFAQIDDSASDKVVVVGNPSQPVAWNHRRTIADAIQKAQPSGTVVIPSSYTGTECNPISSCNPGNVVVIDWRTPQNLTSVTLGFQSLPPALPKIAMPPDPTGNCDYPSAYLLPGAVQLCNLGTGPLVENWGQGNYQDMVVRQPIGAPADDSIIFYSITNGDWEIGLLPWVDISQYLRNLPAGTDLCAVMQTYTTANPFTMVWATGAPVKFTCNSPIMVTVSNGGLFNGAVVLPRAIAYIPTASGLQSVGSGQELVGGGWNAGVNPSAGTETLFRLCGPQVQGYNASPTLATGDYLLYCVTSPGGSPVSYTAALSGDAVNYPPIIALSNYPPTDGLLHNASTNATGFSARVIGIDVDGGGLSNVTCYANWQEQEGSKFDNFQWRNCTGAGSIGLDWGGAQYSSVSNGGGQNAWATDFHGVTPGTTPSGQPCTNAASAVGIRISTYGGSNGNPNLIDKGSIVNNCSNGTLPAHVIEYTSGANAGMKIADIHMESCGVDCLVTGIVTIKGVDAGQTANGLSVDNIDIGPNASGSSFHIAGSATIAGAVSTNIDLQHVRQSNTTPTNLVTVDGAQPIPASAAKYVLELATGSSGQILRDTSGTNIANFLGAIGLGTSAFSGLSSAPLSTAANGTVLYCTDCKNVTDDTTGTFDSAAASGGHGTIVLRENGAWRVH